MFDLIAFPDKKYYVVYADPPWSYSNKKTGGSMTSGSAQKYPTMTLQEIKDLPIADITDKDGLLFLWATVPMLPEAMDTLNAWGYKYKTAHFWIKLGRLGMGFWFRVNVEILLVGVRGQVKPFRLTERNHFSAKPEKHSEKPEYYRQLIEKTVGDVPKIELFARQKTPGWDVWGNEVS